MDEKEGGKPSRSNKSPSQKSAEDFKEFCRQLIKDRVKTLEDREALAKELGFTVGGVEALIYHGRGSFESFVAAVFYLYEFDAKMLQEFLTNMRDHVRRIKPASESDRAWYELDKFWSEDQKGHFAFMALAAARLNLALTRIKSKGSED